MEVVCSTCGGRLKSETPGIVVECPHCQTHLQIPAVDAETGHATGDATPVDTSPAETQPEQPPPADNHPPDVADRPFAGLAGAEPAPADASPFPVMIDTDRAEQVVSPSDLTDSFAEIPVIADHSRAPASAETQPSLPLPDEPEFPSFSDAAPTPPAEHGGPIAIQVDGGVDRSAEAVAVDVDRPAQEPRDPAGGAGSPPPAPRAAANPTANGDAPAPAATAIVAQPLFLVIAGYAIVATIALVILWIRYRNQQELNLPDVVPQQDGQGKVVFRLVPENAKLPARHRLKLGEMRRFGFLEVTPVKVTRGPVVLSNEYGEEPTDEVLKLWLKIRNVSDRQTFAPLGRTLARQRSEDGTRANTFVCRIDQKSAAGDRLLMYDIAADDPDFVIKGQNIDRALKPGEDFETFLATDSDDDRLAGLNGNLVWRVRVRKGYNPVNKWGITTLFEVDFHSDQVSTE